MELAGRGSLAADEVIRIARAPLSSVRSSADADRDLESEEPGLFLLAAAIPLVLTRLGDELAVKRMEALPDDGWQAKEPGPAPWRRLWAEAKASVAKAGTR